jgi:aspartate racemase
MQQFVGVLGGMGPLATVDFLKKLVVNMPTAVDQEHVPVLLYGDCTVPERNAAIAGAGPSPLPKLLAGIAFLAQAGVRAICIPCNTAHYWHEEMAAASPVPVFHIVRASAAEVRQKNPSVRSVGVLSTLGTQQSGIYRAALTEMGLEVVESTEEEFEELVLPGIALVKSNQLAAAEILFAEAAACLCERGAETIILGCTEIPLGMQHQLHARPAMFVDSTDALARAVIDFWRK